MNGKLKVLAGGLGLALMGFGADVAPVKIIFDTDIYTDFDDTEK